MAKVKYRVAENTKVGTHSFYAIPQWAGTLSTEEILDEALDGKSIEPSVAKAAIEEFMKAVQRNVLKGFRCQLGKEFLTVYPNLQLSVKDRVVNGQTVVATADMVNAANGKSRLGCTVATKFSAQFAAEVKWTKVQRGVAEAADQGEDITDTGDSSSEQEQQPAASDAPVLTVQKTGTGTLSLTDQTGHQIDSGAAVQAGQTLTLSVTPSGSATPTATIGTQSVTLTEDEGQWVGTFQMPAASATLTVRTGGTGDNEE